MESINDVLTWLTDHESAFSTLAAIIAIIAGVAVGFRLIWARMPSHVVDKVKNPGVFIGLAQYRPD